MTIRGTLCGVRTVPTGQLPPGLADVLRPVIAALGDELVAAIAAEVPAYARPLEGSFGQGVQRGVHEALMRFLGLVETSGAARPGHGLRAGAGGILGGTALDGSPSGRDVLAAGRDLYVALGRGEVLAGRTLDTLLGAYRVGARIAWRRLAVAATQDGGLGTDGLVVLAEMMFAYIDEISAASAEGYAQAQSSAAGERERLRERVAELLLDGGDPELIKEKARAASYRVPDAVAAVVAAATDERSLAARLPDGTPMTVRGQVAIALVAHSGDPGWRANLERTVGGLRCVVGPGTEWAAAAAGAERAMFAHQARAHGRLPARVGPAGTGRPGDPDGSRDRGPRDGRGASGGAGTGTPGLVASVIVDDPLFTEDHLLALMFARDPDLVSGLAARRLAPLATLPATTRRRLAETLLHWLALNGQRGRIAEALHVHPQTVRYRVNQLRTHFGAALDDPTIRFELELVLRAGYGWRPRTDGQGAP
ncbi:MAG: helix-turn-helix domain-containing protein [Frankia sp.]